MTGTFTAAVQAVITHPLFGFGITLAVYQVALALFERTRWIFLQPVLLSVSALIAVLMLLGIDYSSYKQSASMLTVFLGPATVALAVPLFMNLKRIRQLFWPILITLCIAGTLATVLGIGLAWLFGIDTVLQKTLLPKSVTSPIAMLVAEEIGGIAALAAIFVLITGVLGAIFGPALLTRLGVTSPAARGMAMGLAAHAVGTAQALQEGEETGAFSALAMSLMGVATAIMVPLVMALI
ncbi:MAG: LrgB family protein [Pseudomonas sp.]